MINFLKKIGYYTKNLSKINLVKLVKSFQRRFRQNLINGDGEGVGTSISTHPDIDMISFKGSKLSLIHI